MSTFDRRAVQVILDCPQLTQQEKISQLRRLAYDVREMSVAAEEGMTGADHAGPDLAVVQRALRSLGADRDAASGAKQ